MATTPFPINKSYNPGDLTSKGGLKHALSQQYGDNLQFLNQQNNQRGSEFNTLMPGLDSMLNSGYSDAEKSGMEQGSLGAIQAQSAAAKTQAGERLARTGNSAGYGSALNQNSRQTGQDLAQQELNNQKDFADEKQRRKLQGLQGIASLYGVDSQLMSALDTNQNQTLAIGQSVQAGRRGVLGNIGAGIADIGGALNVFKQLGGSNNNQ